MKAITPAKAVYLLQSSVVKEFASKRDLFAFFKLGLKGCSLGIKAYTKDTVHLVLQKAKSLVWCWTTSVFKEFID